LLATAIPHHKFRKLSPCQARKVGSNLRNRADPVIMPVDQSFSFRRFRSANYFPHSAFPQITHTRTYMMQPSHFIHFLVWNGRGRWWRRLLDFKDDGKDGHN